MLKKHLFLSLLMLSPLQRYPPKPIMHIGLTQVKTMLHTGVT